ncbi:hypothetical protein MPER_13601 [Moniliophthora perniciosa FA553]|nr:hypothetical protein MPER_13601 [Moniliophthora perniciosa FA553]
MLIDGPETSSTDVEDEGEPYSNFGGSEPQGVVPQARPNTPVLGDTSRFGGLQDAVSLRDAAEAVCLQSVREKTDQAAAEAREAVLNTLRDQVRAQKAFGRQCDTTEALLQTFSTPSQTFSTPSST